MSVHIKYTDTRTVEEGPVYKIEFEVIEATGIESEIFVFNTETQNYEHVATVFDMEHFPDTRAEAQEDELPYYRQDTVTVGYESLAVAEEFVTYTKERIATLAREYYTATEEYIGSETVIVDEP